jgi:hypothetical protein
MKSKIFLLYSIIFWVTMSITGCSTQTEINSIDLPGISIPENQMNTKINLYAPPESNTFDQGDEVAVVVENLTESQIIFPEDYGIKIFTFSKSEKKWLLVENGMGYPEGETVLLPKKQQLFGGILIVFYPIIDDSDQLTTIRVVVVGTIQDSKMDSENVGAYIDITLNPK